MHIVYANVHSRAFALLALITRLPILGGNLPFAKRPISDHSEPIPNLHGKGIFWPHRSWKIQLTTHNHHLQSYFGKLPANILPRRYLCTLVFALQCFIFSELVGVRKRQAAEKRLPLFRSIQWAWFFAPRPTQFSTNGSCDLNEEGGTVEFIQS